MIDRSQIDTCFSCRMCIFNSQEQQKKSINDCLCACVYVYDVSFRRSAIVVGVFFNDIY